MYGVVTPLVTPFTQNDKIDFPMLEKLVDFLIKSGVHGLYPNGTTAEMHTLTVQEREDIAQCVLDCTDRRVDVFVQTGAASAADTMRLTDHAISIGAAGVGVITPWFMKLCDEEMIQYYKAVSASVPEDTAVYLYNIPQFSGNDLSPQVINELLSVTKNVAGIKYSFADYRRLREYTHCGSGNFDVIIGAERLFLPGMAAGCKGIISASTQVDPIPFLDCYRSFTAGDYASAIAADNRIHMLLDAIHDGSRIAYFKAGMRRNGFMDVYTRRPLLDLTAEEIFDLEYRLQRYTSSAAGTV